MNERRFLPAALLATQLSIVCHVARADEAPQPRVLTPSEIETIVLQSNRDLRLARIAVDGARAGVLQADVRPNPTLSWNAASYSPSAGLGSGNVLGKRVDQIVRLDQTVERGGKRDLRIAVAESQLDGRRLDVQEQRRNVLQRVRNAYIDLLLAEKRIDVISETQRSYESSLDAATRRVKAGDLATADLARLRVEVLRARTDGETALADRIHAQAALALLLDLAPQTLATDGRWPAPVTTHAMQGIAYRPDVASAERAVDAARRSVELARSQRTRDVTVGVQFERYPGPGGTGNTIGFGISVPLLIGDDHRGDIARAASDRLAAEETAAQVRAAAVADAAAAEADLATAERRLETYRSGLLDAAQSAAKSADFAFDRGALGLMDLMDARRTLLATRLDALSAEADYARAVAAVAAASTRVDAGDAR